MKRKYTGLKKATAFALMLGLTAQFTACGGAEKVEESNEVVEVTVTPTPTPIEEVTNTPTPEQGNEVEVNVTGYNENLPDYEQTYMTFEDIEPTVMVAVKDSVVWGNPNATEGKLMVDGSVMQGDEHTITAKGEFEGKKYWAYKNDNNRWFIVEEEVLQVKGQEKAEPTPTQAPSNTENSGDNGNSGDQGNSGDNGGSAQPTAVPTTPPAQPVQQATEPDYGDIFGGDTTDSWVVSEPDFSSSGLTEEDLAAFDGFTIE